mmetsp:Transcript_15429/g.45544  ORF Transcript_15429/g.45544 Transcript_15429/m.45544 type:complete len:242 (+) Transcript_15429:74-799(+)
MPVLITARQRDQLAGCRHQGNASARTPEPRHTDPTSPPSHQLHVFLSKQEPVSSAGPSQQMQTSNPRPCVTRHACAGAMPPLAMAVPSLASEPPTRHAPPLAESSGSMQHTQTAQRALLVSLIRQRETSGCTNVVHAARSGVRDSRGLPTPFTGPLNPLCERLSSPGSTNAVHLLWPDVVLAAFDSAKPGRRGAHVAVADGTCPARRSVLEHVVGRAAAAVACAVPEHVARGPPAVAAARP